MYPHIYTLYTYIHAYPLVYHVSTCIHMYPYVSTCIHTYPHVYTRIHMYPYVYTCIHTIHMCTHVSTCIHTYSHVSTRIHMYPHWSDHRYTVLCNRMFRLINSSVLISLRGPLMNLTSSSGNYLWCQFPSTASVCSRHRQITFRKLLDLSSEFHTVAVFTWKYILHKV